MTHLLNRYLKMLSKPRAILDVVMDTAVSDSLSRASSQIRSGTIHAKP